MTLRTKLFLLLAGLLAGLGATQWLLYRSLTDNLRAEVRAATLEVGNWVMEVLAEEELATVPDPEVIPATRIIPVGEALVLSKKETAGGQVEFDLKLGPSEEAADAESIPMVALQPALPPEEHRFPVPQQGFEAAFEHYATSLTLGFASLSVLGLLLAGVLAWRITAPLRSLSVTAARLGEGELGVQADVQGSGEIAATTQAFNRMSRDLAAYEKRRVAMRDREHLSEIGEVARALAHSLRNPLHALGLTLERLASELPQAGAGREEAAAARAQILRIDGTVRSLLAVSGAAGASVEDVRVEQLARDVALEVMQDTGSEIEVEVPERPGSLQAVPAELRAVLHTLVVNAVEASPPGAEVQVLVAPAPQERVRVQVLDRGSGLSSEALARLFEPHATTKESGTGMGLFLAQRIVQGPYAGQLELTNRPGGGTCARLELGDRAEEPIA